MSAPDETTAADAVPRTATVLPCCSIEQLLGARVGADGPAFVDLRAPVEFTEDHLPGAISLPLFDDDERALVGTLYRRASPDRAYTAGLELIERRIAELVHAIANAAGLAPPSADVVDSMRALTSGGKAALEGRIQTRTQASLAGVEVVVGCWRGGLRSQSVCALLRHLGYDARLLDGGYRAYRRHVHASLTAWTPPPRAITLRGHTGVGKTLVLHAIERQAPGWTVDLEGLAGHRSSILGMVGREPVTQKTFESLLFERLQRGFPAGTAVFEGESRKIGDAIQPEPLWRTVRSGLAVRLTASVERRTEVLAEDYLATPESIAQLERQLPFIEKRLGKTKFAGVLVDMLRERRITELVPLLLERYYDPLYRHSEGEIEPALTLDSSDPDACATRILDWTDGV